MTATSRLARKRSLIMYAQPARACVSIERLLELYLLSWISRFLSQPARSTQSMLHLSLLPLPWITPPSSRLCGELRYVRNRTLGIPPRLPVFTSLPRFFLTAAAALRPNLAGHGSGWPHVLSLPRPRAAQGKYAVRGFDPRLPKAASATYHADVPCREQCRLRTCLPSWILQAHELIHCQLI